MYITLFIHRLFHKTLPRSSAFVNCISVRFYETGCTIYVFTLLYISIICYPDLTFFPGYSSRVVEPFFPPLLGDILIMQIVFGFVFNNAI